MKPEKKKKLKKLYFSLKFYTPHYCEYFFLSILLSTKTKKKFCELKKYA